MRIKWHGHSCFSIESGGKILLTDPFDKSVGYKIPDVNPDLITESHQHFDHNAHHLLKGNFEVIDKLGEYSRDGFVIKGYLTYHDSSRGAERGTNIVFEFTTPDGIRILHLGDLGVILERDLINKVKNPDILMIPVGGVYTIGPSEAFDLSKELAPKIVIPMHFKTEALKFKLISPEDFLSHFDSYEEKEELLITSREELSKLNMKVIKLKY
ncbi:MBL fold metallo-hydrolase [Kosmotoga pacifica]|uniref:Zn-dependent hydrolase n=1 Tax=Kosmotoga pacifica TaxID=1330330 RepID=A0A0G2Z6K8_9BACT|nr:MBL fold metallo-hydrolase [Kosmotoga pacifica]AKI97192.1 Zn-dependent hydrolase [Kosmotoga pacifica]